MNHKREIFVLGAGSPIVDILIKVDDDFLKEYVSGEKGGMELTDAETIEKLIELCGSEVFKASGGSAANTISGLAKLGMKTTCLAKLGTDDNAAFYKNEFQRIGGDISRFKYHAEQPTAECLSLITPDSERTMRTNLGAAATLSPDEITETDFKDVTHVHTEGYLLFNPPLIKHILQCAKKCNATISLDMASFEVVKASKDFLPELLTDYVDIIFANELEAAEFCGTDNPETAVNMLSEFCEIAVVKLGAKGSIVKYSNEMLKAEALQVDAVDTTGAGDLWATGFLYGYLKGFSMLTCAEMGSLIGAECVKNIGACIPDASWGKIKSELSKSGK